MSVKKEDVERFFIGFEYEGFSTLVEVYDDYSCKCFNTIYTASTTDKTFEEMINLAEEAALEKYVEVFCAYDKKSDN